MYGLVLVAFGSTFATDADMRQAPAVTWHELRDAGRSTWRTITAAWKVQRVFKSAGDPLPPPHQRQNLTCAVVG
jgi:hypothetical protein